MNKELRVIMSRQVAGMARYAEFLLTNGEIVRLADQADIDEVLAAFKAGTPIDDAAAARLFGTA